MEELEKAWRDYSGDTSTSNVLANKEVYVQAECYDWFIRTGATGGASTVIYNNDVSMRILGDSSRTFKPNQMFVVYVSFQQQ